MQDRASSGAARAGPAGWIAARGRWSRLGLAILAGAAMTLGQAPVSFPWALFLALPVLVWLLDAAPGLRAAAATGWAAAFGYFVTGLYWIGHAFLVDPERFAWMMPFAVTLLPAFLGLFWAAAFALAKRVWPPGAWWRPAALAVCLTLAEYARSHVLTGFPWGLPGYVWAETPAMQAAAWAGPFGVTFLTLALVPMVGLAAAERRALPGIAAAACLAGLWVAGSVALGRDGAGPAGPVIRVVQPNADQKLKWQPEHAREFYARLLAESGAPPDPELGRPAAVIWPETAVAFLPAYKPERRAEVAAAANGAVVLLGALHAELRGGAELWYNGLAAILPDASLGPRYDKHHLVPFGEYLPYPSVLGAIGFRQLVQQGGFTPGGPPKAMVVEGLPPFSALICYEMIFPDEVVPPGPRPAWILQVTNDGWFGSYGGPQQHLAQARIRAIEQGLPVVRAANTGISAVIDARGRVLRSLPMHQAGRIDARIPGALPPTLYSRTGDVPALAALLAGLFLLTRRRTTPGTRRPAEPG